MRYILIILVLILGCSTTTLQTPLRIEPTVIEQKIAEPLNYCQRGKYYKLIQYRNDMEFYLNSDDPDVVREASQNLSEINEMIQQMIILSWTKQNKCMK